MGNPFSEAVDKLKKAYDTSCKNVNSYKTKYDVIYEAQQIASTDYKSFEELEEAGKKLDELDEALGTKKNDKDYQAAKSNAKSQLDEQRKILEFNERIKRGEILSDEEQKHYEAFKALENREKELEEFKKKFGLDKEIKKTDQAVAQASYDIDKLAETLSGKVSVDDMSNAASQIDNGYDQAISDLSQIVTGDENTKYLEAWARVQFGDQMYDAASAIKNGASTAISGVCDFMKLDDVFGGSWRDPATAAKKIETGLKTIQGAAQKISNVANSIFSAVTGKQSVLLGKFNNFNSMGVGTLGSLAGMAGTGIGSFNSFKQGNIGEGIGGIKGVFTTYRKTYADVVEQDINNKREELKEEAKRLSQIKHEPKKDETHEEIKENDDFSADMISEINVIIDGNSSSLNSVCIINGVIYRISGYSLTQDLLQPMFINCTFEKEDKSETQADVVFTDVTQLIGKSFEILVSTVKVGKDSKDSQSQKAFVFKGMVIDVAASRSTASAQSACVTVATWDALLQNAPHCRSFENMSLKEIVDSVLKPYKEVVSKVEPRYKEKIPYVVQYNQSDYAFLCMLAVRFGEWMYNTGDLFVFGEMLDLVDSAKLEYPSGNLLSYNLSQQMDVFSFHHLLPDYYQFGIEQGVLKESVKSLADGTVNTWTEKAYNASQQRYNREQLMVLDSGGFDNGKSAEGADLILDHSLKIKALGKKTHLMTVNGNSKLAMLQIGRNFLIRDKVQNRSGQSEDVEQKTLKIIGVNHSFDYGQSYSNSFTAVPEACEYPSYSDANVHVSVPTQRATVVDNKDEQQLGRVRVQFPWQEIQGKEMKTPWLRIAVPYAGLGKGHQFIPEIGEEVMVGFEMDNPERPYIIGALYNGGSGKPDDKWATQKESKGTKNNVKAIRSRNGHTILFNDQGDKGLLEIYDNKNNAYHITFSSDDNKITINSAGQIEVFAGSSIEIHAKGHLGLDAGGDIDIKSKGNISIEAKKEMTLMATKIHER